MEGSPFRVPIFVAVGLAPPRWLHRDRRTSDDINVPKPTYISSSSSLTTPRIKKKPHNPRRLSQNTRSRRRPRRDGSPETRLPKPREEAGAEAGAMAAAARAAAAIMLAVAVTLALPPRTSPPPQPERQPRNSPPASSLSPEYREAPRSGHLT